MTKLYRLPVKVKLDKRGHPESFVWRGRWHRVTNCETCRDNRHWWSRIYRKEPVRYRCETNRGLLCELYYADDPGVWVLERIWD